MPKRIAAAVFALSLPLCPAWAAPLFTPGDEVAGWEVVEVDEHAEYVRYFLDGPGGRTGVEIVVDGAAASDWRTGRHRLMPARGHEPPPELLIAVMERLRRRDATDGSALVAREPRPSGAAPDAVAWAPARVRPTPITVLGLVGIGAAAATATATATTPAVGFVPRLSALFGRIFAAIERQPWPLVLAAAALVVIPRLVGLDQPFDADASTQRIYFATLDLPSIAAHRYDDARHPPLLFLLLHVAFWLGGMSEGVARLPAVIASVLTAVATFAFARPLMGAARSLLAAALLASSVPFLVHGRDVNDVTLFMFLAMLSSHLLLRAIERPAVATVVALAAAEVAMFYAYYLAVLVAGVHVVVALAHGRSRAHGALWLGFAGLVVLVAPILRELLALVIADASMRDVSAAYPTHLWGDVPVRAFVTGVASLLAPSPATAVVGAGLALVGLVRLAALRNPAATLLALLVITTGVAAAVSVGEVRMKPYYFLYIQPFLAVLAVAGALGVEGESSGPGWRAAAVGLGAAALAFIALQARLTWAEAVPVVLGTDAEQRMWRDLGEAIRANGPADRVIADPDSTHTILLWYAFDDDGTLYGRCERSPTQVRSCVNEYGELHALTGLGRLDPGWEERSLEHLDALDDRPFWFVYLARFVNEPLRAHIVARCAPQGTFGDGGLALYRCPASE